MEGGENGFAIRDEVSESNSGSFDSAARTNKRDAQRAILHEMLAGSGSELWIADDTQQAMLSVGPVTLPVDSRVFEYWAHGEYTKRTGAPLGSTRFADLKSLAIAGAVNSGRRFKRWYRWGEAPNGDIVCDLGGTNDPHRGYVVVDHAGGGWSICGCVSSVKFVRAGDALALPIPENDGARAETLRQFIPFQSDDDAVLAWGWIVCAARPNARAYPIAALSGLQGSGKSSAARRLQQLVDPCAVTGRGLPREERDLAAALAARHLLSYDNISGLHSWQSDAFCRTATGGGFSARRLHTDADEHLSFAVRPLIVNGIADVLGRADLADRTIRIELVPPEKRLSDEELDAAWEASWPALFGVLLDGLSAGLRLFEQTKITDAPRMASSARWATACAQGLGFDPSTIVPAWRANRSAGDRAILESDDVAIALIAHLGTSGGEWRGTAAELLRELTSHVSERISHGRDWPSSASGLGLRLKRLVPSLRAGAGIEAAQSRSGADGGRRWSFRKQH